MDAVKTQQLHQEPKREKCVEEKYRPELGYHGDPRLRDFIIALRNGDVAEAQRIKSSDDPKLRIRLTTISTILLREETRRRTGDEFETPPPLPNNSFVYLQKYC